MSNEGIMSELSGEDTPYSKLTIKMIEEYLDDIHKSKNMTVTFLTKESYEEYLKEFRNQLENFDTTPYSE